MEHPVLIRAVEALVRAGEEAGISVEDMIRILNASARSFCSTSSSGIVGLPVTRVDNLPARWCSVSEWLAVCWP
jgi:hypothetical protein